MSEITLLTECIGNHEPLVAMVAPSFPVTYAYPDIVGKIRRLGFSGVVEVSAGAVHTNTALVAAFRNTPGARFITSPCPTLVRLIRKKYPHLLEFLATQIDSPMAATARIVNVRYPGCRPVFIGPCVAKKMEAKEDRSSLGITVITFAELEVLFEVFHITDSERDAHSSFDVFEQHTRLYPQDGGLTESSGVRSVLRDEEIRIVSGWKNCESALREFETNPAIRLLDILFCDGGCINGPGIVSPLPLAERKRRVEDFARRASG